VKRCQELSMRTIDSSHRKTPYRVIWRKFKKLKISEKITQKSQKSDFLRHPVLLYRTWARKLWLVIESV
jgi:hypothetical protein